MTLYNDSRTLAIDEHNPSSVEDERNDWVIIEECIPTESDCSEEAPATPPFRILGFPAAEEKPCHQPVLTPQLMDALRASLPFSLSEENFWLRYSSSRDGLSLISLLQNVRGLHYTVIAVETVGGEIFGSFTSTPWRRERGFYGNGQSFLWKMRESRAMLRASLDVRSNEANVESDMKVFKWSGKDDLIQICNGDRIGMGGGGASSTVGSSGFGFVIEDDLLRGSSGHCETFDNPCLCPRSSDCGGVFEVARIEVYTLTPFMFVHDAEKNEMMKMFLEGRW